MVPPAAAQAYASRASLEQELRAATGRSGTEEARLIRARLDSGDFRAGDRILLTVEGEKELSDTFTVGMATDLTLPQIGVVPLGGVLRAELPARLTQVLERYLRAPVVRVRSLIRVSVEGEVVRPGFYALAPETPLMDAFTVAGGLTRDAKLDRARIEREGSVVMSGRTLETAVRSGRTLDALNLRAGDRVFIPRGSDFTRTVQTLSILATIPVAIFTLIKIF
jgi:protein involved in polysaccharide export with SLBB domain